MAGVGKTGRRLVSTTSARILRAVLAWLICGGWALAQLGDAPGERQAPLVPAERIPPAPALSPEEALHTFQVAPGFRLEIAAAEPLVQGPVAIAFGPDRRMWVVEMRGFMPNLDGEGEDAPLGRVVVLQDRDGDGRYDDSHVFVDGLVLPRTVLPVAGGALVGAPPELAWWQDADGDGRADKKHVLATDYGVKVDPKRPYFANPELAPNGLLWGFDNWIYSAAYTKKFRYVHGTWETAATSFRGQWGLTQDDFGRLYHNSNSDQLRMDVIRAEYLQRNPAGSRLAGANVAAAIDQQVWPGRVTPGVNRGYDPAVLRDGRLRNFTAACAPWIYRGDLLPELHGNAFVAEPAANLVRRNVLVREAGSVSARNAYQRTEFITSTDERFRPVNFATGPDGALYIVDLYRGVLQHRVALTTYLRRQSLTRGLAEPRHLGRIYRVVPAGAAPSRRTQSGALSSAQWLGRLGDPSAWWRETAQQWLVERGDRAVVPAVRELLHAAPPRGHLHALWTLHGLGAIVPADVAAALGEDDAAVWVAALRLSEDFLGGPAHTELVANLLRCTDDPSPEVRLQAVLTLGGARDPEIDAALARTVCAHPTQPYLRDALFSGLAGRELALLESLLGAVDGQCHEAAGHALADGLAGLVWAAREPAAVEPVFTLAARDAAGAGPWDLALLQEMATGAGHERRPLLLPRKPPGWDALARIPACQESLSALAEAAVWPGKPGAAAVAATPLTPAQQLRFEAGRKIYAGLCAACHQASGRGLDGLAPPLLDSEWVLGNEQRLIRVLLHGLTGPIKVLKRQYTGDMPAFGQTLDDGQIAAVLTYLRRAWGHGANPVEPAHVAAERSTTAGHSGAWSAEELRERNLAPAPSK